MSTFAVYSCGQYDDVSYFFISINRSPQISNFLEVYELVVDLWKYMNRRDD
jgi:hypothetical protein